MKMTLNLVILNEQIKRNYRTQHSITVAADASLTCHTVDECSNPVAVFVGQWEGIKDPLGAIESENTVTARI